MTETAGDGVSRIVMVGCRSDPREAFWLELEMEGPSVPFI